MKSVQFIKQLNNTEVGKSGTNDTYILIPQGVDVSDLFEEIGREYPFRDKESGQLYALRYTCAREKRIVGLGQYYRDQNAQAGDRVLLEKRMDEDGICAYYIDLAASENTAFFQKVKSSFESLTPEKAVPFLREPSLDVDGRTVTVRYSGEIRKRKDSPTAISVYDILVGEERLQESCQGGDMIGLCSENGRTRILRVQPWKKCTIEVNEP